MTAPRRSNNISAELAGALVLIRYSSGATECRVTGEFCGVQSLGSSGFAVIWSQHRRHLVRLASINSVEVMAMAETPQVTAGGTG